MTAVRQLIDDLDDAREGLGTVDVLVETPDGDVLMTQSVAYDVELDAIVIRTSKV